MTRFLAISVFVGLLFPATAQWMRPLLYPSLFVIMLCTLVQIDLGGLKSEWFNSWRQILRITLVQMVLLPLGVSVLLRVTSVDSVYAVPAVLVTCAGSMFGTPAIAILLGLEGRFALLGVLLSTLILPLTLPLVWWVYSGTPLEMELQAYLMRLFIYIVCPGLLALVYRKIALNMPVLPRSGIFKIGAVIGLVIFAIAIMDGVTARLLQDPKVVLGLVALGFFLHFGLYGFARWSARRLDPPLGVESGLLSAFRNIGLIIAVSGPFLPADFFLFAGVWQIPMYLSPWIFNRLIKI